MYHGRAAASVASLLLVLSFGRLALAADLPQVAVKQLDGKVEITIGGRRFATYFYRDPKITRPYFAHVHAPDGTQVTRHHPPIPGQDTLDHPEFHPGIWMAFGDISGNDYWRLKARVENGDMIEEPRGGAGEGAFAVRNRYLDAADPHRVVCNEFCRFRVVARPEGALLLWDSTFTGNDEFSFGDQEEMGLGIRVATPLRVQVVDSTLPPPTGTMTDAKGGKNGAQIGGNSAEWCDYSGTVDGHRVGMTIFCHPDNFRPSWFHARDYGFLAANAFGRAAFHKGETSKIVVKPGESLRLRYGILVHSEEDGNKPDLDAAYQDYLQLTKEHH
jgi:hypothetical protein